MDDRCTQYADERCQRPREHDGLHWGEYGTVWRDATDEETAEFTAEMTARGWVADH